jgi:glycosyltransferase involved in cell wall biosynthesis
MVNILFITYHDFSSNSAIQIHNFANNLVKMGNDCCIAVPFNKNSVHEVIGGEVFYTPLEYSELDNPEILFKNGENPDIIHAWTPREIVRKQTMKAIFKFHCKLVIHLEDNEERITEDSLCLPIQQLRSYSLEKLNSLIPDHLSHPVFYKEFLSLADGITIIIDQLADFVPKNKQYCMIWPGIDASRFDPDNPEKTLRRDLGIEAGTLVICYTGNVHASNAREVRSLYLAVALLNREGITTKLIRTGNDYVKFLGDDDSWAHENSLELGFVSHEKIPGLLSISDVLIQPGKADIFNEYRLPSKLPEFFLMGKPVILPKVNIGHYIKNNEEAILLDTGDARDIAEKMKLLRENPDLSRHISKKGREFAEREFNSEVNTMKLEGFYKKILGIDAGKNSSHARFLEIRDKYKNYVPSDLGYATVKDFCDSAENFKDICRLNGDLKNVQRPWIIKAIIASVPFGGKLIEIGAGEPIVASYLHHLGYDVTIIDPYDGTGNGPVEYAYFRKHYPHLKIIKNYFEEGINTLDGGSYDCVYSISVLEHIPQEKIKEIFCGIRKMLKAGGVSIHCIDHVLEGSGAKHHDERLRLILDELNLLSVFDDTLKTLKDDVDTYYLSAEGHNLWRGTQRYEDFPFRKVISIQVKNEFR